MTTPRPEDDAGLQGPYAQGVYGADGAFVAAVGGLADPLNDPLPDPLNDRFQDPLNDPPQDPPAGQHASPWFRSEAVQGDQHNGRQDAAPVDGTVPPAYGGPQQPQGAPSEWYDPEGYQRDWYGSQQAPTPSPAPSPAAAPADETLGLRTADTRRIVAEPYEQPERPERPEPAEAVGPPEPSGPAERSEQAERVDRKSVV